MLLKKIQNKYFLRKFKKNGLDEVLQKKLPWKWTIFAPTNKAFKLHQKDPKRNIIKRILQ